jgi:eukaryotic-like serine/threonine-protein kinase
MDHAPGTVVGGKFRIVRTLGRGGMGTVYEVIHEITKHRRALKLLHREVNAESVKRFLREASVAGTLGDRRIVETFDAGELPTGEPYLVMELLEGETLASRIQREGNRFPIEDALAIVRDVASAIALAHDKGITHRDLKPENVFLTPGGVKVLDFGVSKFSGTEEAALTREGVAIGTPLYMAPEQLRAEKDLDARVDVYALGVVLYETLSGRRPFDADTMTALIVKINEGEAIPLGMVRSDTPPGLVATVQRAMHRDREQRFQTARALADALGVDPLAATALVASAPMSITTAPPPRRRTWVALLALPILAGVVFLATRKTPEPIAPAAPAASPPPPAASSTVVVPTPSVPSIASSAPKPSASPVVSGKPPSKHSAAGLTENPL